MKKVLLGTSAIVAAAAISAPAFASVELEIKGTVDWQAGIVASDDSAASSRGYDFSTDLDITFTSTGTTDNGLTYGSVINLDDSGTGFTIDEAFVYIEGEFGRVVFGDDDAAASVLRYVVEEVGSGLANGDYDRYVFAGSPSQDDNFFNGGDDTKITYIGSFSGFSFGASFSPTNSGALVGAATTHMSTLDGSDYENLISVGAQYVFDFDGGAVGISGGFNYGGADGEYDDLVEWGLGGHIEYGGFALTGFFIDRDDTTGGAVTDHMLWGAGASYSVDAWTIAANYLGSTFDTFSGAADGETHAIGAGAEYALAPGLKFYGEVVYESYDITGRTNDATVLLIGTTGTF